MKKYVAFPILVVLTFSFYLSQRPAETSSEVTLDRPSRARSSNAVAFAESPAVRDLPSRQRPDGSLRDSRLFEVGAKDHLTSGSVRTPDTVQSFAELGTTPMPAPSRSFDGLSNIDNAVVYSLLIIPPDMNGDVGPNHYVQIVNSLFRVYDKNGMAMSPPVRISDLFQSLGTVCSTRIDGLPVVLYDPLADRWLISQTCAAFPPFRQMVAVSKTGDPLGAYYAYEFVMPNVKLNDFPKFGVWTDAYYMSTDEFLGADYVGAGAFAFDRTKLLMGDPSASYVYFNLPMPVGPRRKGLLPADLDGLRPPPAGAPGVFASYTANEYGDAQDALRVFDFRANFSDPLSSTFSERAESPLAVAAFDPTSPEGRADISQPAPGEKLDSQSDRLNYRLAYRNLGSHESLVVNQTVRTSTSDPYRAGVRVYELRKTGAGYAVAEQSTIGSTGTSRWIGSAAQDHQGNLAVQYNVSAEDKMPAIFYRGRLATDPAGVYRPERPLIEGTGVQKAFGWRWGEYSGMVVDPIDDCTFWMTNAYYTLESQEFSDFGWLTRIGSFKFAECSPAPRAVMDGVVTNAVTGQAVLGAVVRAAAYSRATNAAGQYNNLAMLPGTYEVNVSARGYLPQTVSVSISNGQVLIRNFALQPVPIIESTSMQLANESCAINQAAEPGETVTLNISLRNTGVLSAANLNARLLPSAQILNPGSAQTYGSMAAGGSAVSRPFTFTISPSAGCGTPVTLLLEVRDGVNFVGNLSLVLETGVRRFALQENFDRRQAPHLPFGWSTTSSENHQLWRTSTTRKQSAPNSLYSIAPHQMGLNEVTSPAFQIVSSQAEIRFQNWYEFETTFLRNRLYDGSVLELKIGDNDWQDILVAGGVFISGGYDGPLDACCQNPLSGRLSWSGKSGVNQVSEFITTRAKLPPSAAGQTVRLRWRIATDIGGFREGQYIDDLVVSDGFYCECAASSDAPFDFDADGKTDLSVFDLNSGASPDFRILRSSNEQLSSAQWGTAGDKPANADFDGDGKTDLAVYRPSEGNWYILRSLDGGVVVTRFGAASDLPVPGDYDGDDKADVAVFRTDAGVWYIARSVDGATTAVQFGIAGDKPVNEDFDGDNKADVAVYRPSNGGWYAVRSSNGSVDISQFGTAEDRPVPGDYDGDGRADLVVFRPSSSIWYVSGSTAGFSAVQFGTSGDTPMQADFDGDGRRDIAVFRPSSKAWYHLRSSDGGFGARSFGTASERPVPSIFVDR
jgi:hypothetical protein